MKSLFDKIKLKRILIAASWIVVITGLLLTLGFVNHEEKLVKGKDLNINIDYSNNNLFIDAMDIQDFLRSRNDSVKGRNLSDVDINKIEKSLLTHPAVFSAQVSLSIDGNMKIAIKQRDPLVRVFNSSGESFYIDKQARLMPLSENYTAKVPVATGFIWEGFAASNKFNFQEIFADSKLSGMFVLDDIYSMANYISKDTLLSVFIHQINVNRNKEFELFPAVGDQKILFGKCDNFQKKFEKLKIFYKEGLNNINGWNNYCSIDLRFEGQVICKKKQITEPVKKDI